jgi:DNA-binding SARP family transcriptional activator/tetratricopeptide (TPR) repeat protein/TolB-like protein
LLRIKCLGQLSVLRDDGQPLAGAASQPRRLAILALLARSGDRGITREKVIGYLWPDSDEERARRLLSQAVYMLRRDLGSDDAILGVRDLRLGAGVLTSDVAEFQEALDARSYERAATLYGGPFLDGFHLPGAGEFERWVEEERRALDHDSDTAFEKCASSAETRGDFATAVVWWRRMAAKDPINARVAIRLMKALAAAGDRNGAIRHAAIHQALVQEQLDLPADAEVVRFAEELRAGAHSAPQPPVAVSLSPTAPPLPPTPAAVGPVMADPAPGTSAASGSVETAAEPPPIAGEFVSTGVLASSPGAMGIVGASDGTPEPAPSSSKNEVSARSTPRRRHVGPIAAIAAVLLVLVAGGFWFARGHGVATAGVVVPSRVVVAPLENRTGNPALEAVGSMVAEWVTQGLLRTGLVQVVDARTMLETARDAGPSRGDDYLRTLAERTGAGTVVSGSYFIEGDQLRFLMRITGAPSGEVRHTVDVVNAPVTRPTAALEPLRQRITGALAVLLDSRLNNWTARTSQPPTYEAYGEFLLGMETFGPDYENSVRHFTRAAQLDTTYWQAMLWDAMANANLRRYVPADSLFRILDRNRANLASYDEANLDYFYAGFIRGDWETSYRGARRMVELAPGAAHALYAAGLTAEITNRPREAIDVLRRINTREGWGKAWAPRVYNLIARSYHQLGDYQHDLEWAKQLRASEPNVGWTRLEEVKATAALGRGKEAFDLAVEGASFPSTTETWEDYTPGDFLWQCGRELRGHGHAALAREAFERAERWYGSRPPDEKATRDHRRSDARVLGDLDRWADARARYVALLAEDSANTEHLGALGVLSARLGGMAEADSIAARLVADPRPYTFGAPRMWAARIAAVKGDREGAVALIRQALREGYARLHSLHAEHDLESLRDFPAFREILEPRTSAAQ